MISNISRVTETSKVTKNEELLVHQRPSWSQKTGSFAPEHSFPADTRRWWPTHPRTGVSAARRPVILSSRSCRTKVSCGGKWVCVLHHCATNKDPFYFFHPFRSDPVAAQNLLSNYTNEFFVGWFGLLAQQGLRLIREGPKVSLAGRKRGQGGTQRKRASREMEEKGNRRKTETSHFGERERGRFLQPTRRSLVGLNR